MCKYIYKIMAQKLDMSHIGSAFVNLLFFLLIHSVTSQQSTSSNRSIIYATCGPNSPCIPIKRCLTLRSSPDWENAGETCGPGRFLLRQVCCSGPTLKPVTKRRCGRSRMTSGNVRQGYLIGGTDSREGQWPWMVAMYILSSDGSADFQCSGFLIDYIRVASAAHCFGDRDVSLYQIRIGYIDRTKGEIFTVVRIDIPITYNYLFYDDIAILKLDREVSTVYGLPICLPNPEVIAMNLTSTGTAAAGWGAERFGGPKSLTLKHLEHIPVWSNEACERAFQNYITVTASSRLFPKGVDSSIMCAGFPEGGKDVCATDGGGPLMKVISDRWYVVGITTFGFSCGRPGVPGGFTRVSEFVDWIKELSRD